MLDRLRTAISTLGRTTKAAANRTISLVSSYLYDAKWLIDTTWTSLIKETYGKNSVVYACIKELCRGVPEATLRAYTGEDDDKKALDRQHELMQLIRRPNELMTEYEMLELATIHLAVVGKTVWWKERNNLGRPIALWPLRPDRVGPIYAPLDGKPGQKLLAGWSYQDPTTGGYIGIPRRDTFTINFPDPDGESGGIVEGLGPLSVLSREVAADNKATEHVGALMANHAQPTVVILVKESGLTEEDAKLIKAKFRSDFGGSNLGTPGVMDGESDVKILGFSLKDLEFPGLRDNAEARICSVLGVPAVLAGVHVGLKESNQRATTKELREYFTETTLSAYWRRYADQFTLELAADFGEGIYCEFDTSTVKALAGQRLEAMQPIKEGFAAGIVMVNQYREKLSLPSLPPEYGEVFYIPNSVTVVPATDAAKAVLDQRAQENIERQQERMALQEPRPEEGEGRDDEAQKPTKSIKAVDPREEAERRLQKALEALFSKLASDIAGKIVKGEAVDDTFLAVAFGSVIEPQLVEAATAEGIRIAAEVVVAFDPAVINQAAVDWARAHAGEMIPKIAETTRKAVGDTVAKYAATPGMTRGELEAMLRQSGFSAVRAEAIAVSEVTDAYSAATDSYQAMLKEAGLDMERVWHASGDELVCPLCGPLNNKPESEWEKASPGTGTKGPKRHVRCRCKTTLRMRKGQPNA